MLDPALAVRLCVDYSHTFVSGPPHAIVPHDLPGMVWERGGGA